MNNKEWVIIANGEPCKESLVLNVCVDKPVLVLDGAIDGVLKLNLNPDFVLGDFDSLTTHIEDLKRTKPTLRWIHAPDQNFTDLEKGLHFAFENGAAKVHVLWGTGRRMDHFLANISVVKKYDSESIVFHDDFGIGYRLPLEFEHNFKENSVISLLGVGETLGITTKNLKYPLKNESLELGVRNGNSNCVSKTGLVKITHTSGCLLLFHCWD
jgi:thiamine pyrophosphokinase